MAEKKPSPYLNTTGVILAGGASRRMGGQDKGLISFRGEPLVSWVARALAPQVDEVIIVANRNLDVYGQLGFRVFSDLRPDYPGPLAGIEAALAHARTPRIITCPTDAPLLPADFVRRMQPQDDAQVTEAVVAGRPQPVFCNLPRTVLPNLSQYLDEDRHKVQSWLDALSPVFISFDDQALSLRDADTPEDLVKLDAARP